MDQLSPQQRMEAVASLLLGKIETCANALDVVLVTTKTKTVEKEDGLSREEVRESQEGCATGVIDHRALKNLTAALKDLKGLVPEEAREKTIRVIFQGGEDPWRS